MLGWSLLNISSQDGMKIFAYDIDSERLGLAKEKYGVIPIGEDEVYDQDVDIYAPCALGATINDETIPRLKCNIIAGAANNVLKDPNRHAREIVTQRDFICSRLCYKCWWPYKCIQ